MTHRRRSLRMAALVGILTVIAAVFVCSGAVLFAQRDHEGFAFVEQEGDASVLEDIRITGVLTDSFQRISFASQGRELTQRILPQALMDEVREKSHVVGYDYEPLPGTETKVQFYNAGEEIKNPDGSVNQADTSTISETADQFTLFLEDGFHSDFRIQTQIVYHKTLMQLYYADQNGKKGLMSRSGGFQPWDTVQLDGIRYTVTLTDENCRGTGGIYDMTDVPDSSSGEAVTIHKKNLFPIDLSEWKGRDRFIGGLRGATGAVPSAGGQADGSTDRSAYLASDAHHFHTGLGGIHVLHGKGEYNVAGGHAH